MAKIFVSFNLIGITDDVIIVARELDNLLAEVTRIKFDAPHSLRNFTFTNLNPVMHQIQVWTTNDGTTLLTLKGSCDIDASMSTDAAFQPSSFIVDRGYGAPNYDPVSGDNTYVNPDLADKDYMVFRAGQGPLIPGVHIEFDETGGFHFIDGQTFSNGEEYSLLIFNTITKTTVSGKPFPDGVEQMLTHTDFGAQHYNKLIRVDGTGAVVNLNILDMNVIPENTLFGVNTHWGAQRYLAIKLPVGVFCDVMAEQRNIIYVGKGETVNFIKKAGLLWIINWDGDFRRVGERVKTDGRAPLNGLQETGGWYLKADYPRLFEWYINELPLDNFGVGTEDTQPDGPNRTKWIIGPNKFWIPDTADYFDRNGRVAGTDRPAGSNQGEAIRAHFHDVGTTTNMTLQPTDPRFNRSVKPHAVRSWNTSPKTDNGQLSSTDLNYNVSSGAEETETRPMNVLTNVYRIF